MLEGGVTITQTCHLFIHSGHWIVVREAFRTILLRLQEGHSISEAVSNCLLFLPVLHEILLVAEQSGTLGGSLLKLGEQLEEELDIFVERATAIAEALVTIGSGSIVFLIMMILFIPMFHLISQF